MFLIWIFGDRDEILCINTYLISTLSRLKFKLSNKKLDKHDKKDKKVPKNVNKV